MTRTEDEMRMIERTKFALTGLPSTRADMMTADAQIKRLVQSAGPAVVMTITVLPPDAESSEGAFTVTLKDTYYTVSFTSVHLSDAIFIARSNLWEMHNERKHIEPTILEVSADTVIPTVERPVIDASMIRI
jgi:hypothetical protein